MNTITIPLNEYKQTLDMQKSILSRLDLLQEMVFESTKDEISSSLLKRYEKISKSLDNQKGKRFTTKQSFKNYLKDL
jgi:hypothetical protein